MSRSGGDLLSLCLDEGNLEKAIKVWLFQPPLSPVTWHPNASNLRHYVMILTPLTIRLRSA
jgi:hypothetical protein